MKYIFVREQVKRWVQDADLESWHKNKPVHPVGLLYIRSVKSLFKITFIYLILGLASAKNFNPLSRTSCLTCPPPRFKPAFF